MNAQYLEKFLYPVAAVDLPDGRFIRNELTGSILSKVSDRYTVVQNKDLITPFVETLGVDKFDSVRTYNGRRSFMFQFVTGREVDLGGGDILKERIIIRNSYDKTRSFSFMSGALRMVCTNGLYVGVGSVLAFKKIHVGEIPTNEIVHEALTRFSRNDFSFWRRLKEIPLTVEQERDLLVNWTPYAVEEKEGVVADPYKGNLWVNSKVKQYAHRIIGEPETLDNQRNAWGLFNQMNQAIERVLPNGAVDKKINGNERAEEFLKTMLVLKN